MGFSTDGLMPLVLPRLLRVRLQLVPPLLARLALLQPAQREQPALPVQPRAELACPTRSLRMAAERCCALA